jgi:hypothetical protein
MDKLEDFIRNNRGEIDYREPSPRVWKGIRKNTRRQGKSITIWSAAASVLILIGTSLILLLSKADKRHVSGSEASIMKNNPQLLETEFYYNNMAKTLYNEASPMLVGYPDLKIELNADMAQIDSLCADIKKDLRDNVSNQQVIEALIKNYRIKTEILQEMLNLLRQEQNPPEKPKSHEL